MGRRHHATRKDGALGRTVHRNGKFIHNSTGDGAVVAVALGGVVCISILINGGFGRFGVPGLAVVELYPLTQGKLPRRSINLLPFFDARQGHHLKGIAGDPGKWFIDNFVAYCGV